jgi:hypothetical protein
MGQMGWVTRQNLTQPMLAIYRREFRTYISRDYADAPHNHIARARMKTFNELILLARLKGEL